MKWIRKIIILIILTMATLTPSQNSFAYQILFQNDTFDTVESNGILIDTDNTATDITLQFGNTLAEYIKWNSTNTRFEFSDDIDLLSNQIYNARLENITALPGGASGLGMSGTGRIVQLTVTDTIAPGCTVTSCTPGTYSWDGVKWIKYAPSCGPGTYPTIDSITTTTFGTDATTHNVTMPASVEAGDLLLAFFTNDGSATVTTPSGWTAVTTLARGTAARGSIYAKISVGTEGGTTVNFVTSAAEQGAAQVYKILSASWYGSITSGIATASYDPGAATNAPNPPSLTPAWGADYDTWIVYAAGSSWTTVTTYPTNYNNGTHTISNTGTAGASVSTARRTLNAATDDPGAFAMTTTSDGVAFTIAVRPFNCSSSPGNTAIEYDFTAAAGNNNNISISNATYVRMNQALNYAITGIAGGSPGRQVTLRSTSNNNSTFNNEDTNSLDINRIRTQWGGQLTLNGEGSVTVIYDSNIQRWVVISYNQ